MLESETLNVNGVAFAAAVGVPVIAPVDGVRANPAGRLPDTSDHVYGGVPPVAPSVALYAVPTCPPGKVVVVTANPGFVTKVADPEG